MTAATEEGRGRWPWWASGGVDGGRGRRDRREWTCKWQVWWGNRVCASGRTKPTAGAFNERRGQQCKIESHSTQWAQASAETILDTLSQPPH